MKSLAAKIRFGVHEYAVMFAHQNAFFSLKSSWYLGGPKRRDENVGVDLCGCIGLFSSENLEMHWRCLKCDTSGSFRSREKLIGQNPH